MGPVFTVGHSTRTLDELVRICEAHGIRAIADVRRFPGSRRSPHFARKVLEESLPARGIDYSWLPELGGRRKLSPDAAPTGWKVEAFAAYAEHMRGPEFRAGIEAVLAAAAARPTATMCAEAWPYRCHRRLIADWLELHGIEVVHLIDEDRADRHQPTSFARRVGDDIAYPGEPQLELPLG